MPTRTEVLWRIARHEVRAALRGRMVPALALLFGLLALAIALAGLGGSGRLLVQGFTRTAVSLLALAVYLLPLVGLVLGAAAFGDEDGGSELLLAQPIGRTEALLGRMLGLALAVAGVAAAGFLPAGVAIALRAGTEGAGGYALMALGTAALGLVGLSAGTLLGVVARRRATAIGWALGAGLGAAVLYDLACILVLQLAGSGRPGGVLVFLLALNPIDGVRALALVGLGADVLLGPAGAALSREMSLGGGALWVGLSLLCWLSATTGAAAVLHARRDL